MRCLWSRDLVAIETTSSWLTFELSVLFSAESFLLVLKMVSWLIWWINGLYILLYVFVDPLAVSLTCRHQRLKSRRPERGKRRPRWWKLRPSITSCQKIRWLQTKVLIRIMSSQTKQKTYYAIFVHILTMTKGDSLKSVHFVSHIFTSIGINIKVQNK